MSWGFLVSSPQTLAAHHPGLIGLDKAGLAKSETAVQSHGAQGERVTTQKHFLGIISKKVEKENIKTPIT